MKLIKTLLSAASSLSSGEQNIEESLRPLIDFYSQFSLTKDAVTVSQLNTMKHFFSLTINSILLNDVIDIASQYAAGMGKTGCSVWTEQQDAVCLESFSLQSLHCS